MKYLAIVFSLFLGFQSAAQTDEVIDEVEVKGLLTRNTCNACHLEEGTMVGPSYLAIAKKEYDENRIVELIYDPEPENWPNFATPMAPMKHVPKEEALKIAKWINSLKP